MLRRAADQLSARLAALPSAALFALFFLAVALGHLTLLHLPYYWDEGGYYIPAALDFYQRWTLIPEFTNAHPPLPNVTIGLLWHIFGFHIIVTRLCAAAFAAAGLVAVFRIGQRLISPAGGLALALLTAVYPIWYAQSTLAHADIFAAAFTLWGFAVYFRSILLPPPPTRRDLLLLATLFSLAALSKETAILQSVALASVELGTLIGTRWFLHHAHRPAQRQASLARLAALSFPILPLIAWYTFHHARTGFTFGNPEYLRYNAQSTMTIAHISTALRYRFLHLCFQRDIWLPIALALSCLLLHRRSTRARRLGFRISAVLLALIFANWIAFSVLGGALLTRYLLPVYPLILLICLALWHERTSAWPWFALASTAAFVSAWWLNPPVAFAPEDNLTYRDMIVVHQEAAHYLDRHFPHATVLTAWPMSGDLFRTELGYTHIQYKIFAIDNFSAPEVLKAAQDPGRYDTAVVFTTRYAPPALEHYLQSHPNSARYAEFSRSRDLTPEEVARILHGQVVWKDNRNGEVAAVLRFNRSYDAALLPPR